MNEVNNDKPFGKFSSAEELLGAYKALEREFTKRCMRLKDAENEIERLKDALGRASDESAAERAVEEYLLAVLSNKTVPSLNSDIGTPFLSPVRKAKNLGEARALAEKMLK